MSAAPAALQRPWSTTRAPSFTRAGAEELEGAEALDAADELLEEGRPPRPLEEEEAEEEEGRLLPKRGTPGAGGAALLMGRPLWRLRQGCEQKRPEP